MTKKPTFEVRSKSMLEVYDRIKKYALNARLCLIHGESGIGKEFSAHYYYKVFKQTHSSNAEFIVVNCAGVSKETLLSELFGMVNGIYDKTKGLFFESRNKVLFLDEVSDIHEEVQAVLVKETKELVSIADSQKLTQEFFKHNTFVICSCSNDGLNNLSQAFLSRFSSQIQMPSLFECEEDIPRAVKFFITYSFLKSPIFQKPIIANNVIYDGDEKLLKFKEWGGILASQLYSFILSNKWKDNYRSLRNAINNTVDLTDYKESEQAYLKEFVSVFKKNASNYIILKTSNSLPKEKRYPQYVVSNNELLKQVSDCNTIKKRDDILALTSFLTINSINEFRIIDFLNYSNKSLSERRKFQAIFRELKDASILSYIGVGVYKKL